MRSIFKGLLAAAALGALASGPAHAATTTLVDGGGWSPFFFYVFGGDDGFQDASGNDLDFTFTLTKTSVLRVTDGFNNGDQFDLTINGADQGPTSDFATDAASLLKNDLDCWSCAFFTDGAVFSHGQYILGPGTYDVTGQVVFTIQGNGEGAFALGAVPEPATWAMMLTGFFGLGAVLRRSRRAGAALA